jgi:hypothetical protein
MNKADEEAEGKVRGARSAAKYYFLTVWAACLVTFIVGEFNPAVRAFIFENLWWFAIAAGLAIVTLPLTFPRGVSGLAKDLKQHWRDLGSRKQR